MTQAVQAYSCQTPYSTVARIFFIFSFLMVYITFPITKTIKKLPIVLSLDKRWPERKLLFAMFFKIKFKQNPFLLPLEQCIRVYVNVEN